MTFKATGSLSLRGATVLVTRASSQAGDLSQLLRAKGARVVAAPAIRLEPPRSWSAVDRALRAVRDNRYSWLVLTSANGVEFLFDRLSRLRIDTSTVRRVEVAAVGPGTAAALRKHRVAPAFVPASFTTSAIGKSFPRGYGRVLLARADKTEPGLEEAIAKRGWTPERVVLYRLLREKRLDPGIKQTIRSGGIDVVTFASGGTVRAFASLLGGELPPSTRIACIGPVTARVARELGLRVDAVAREHTISGLAAAAGDAWRRKRR